MAVLNTLTTRPLWRGLWDHAASKAEWRGVTLPPLNKIHDAFQALENRLEASRPTLKADIDGALGLTTTAGQARAIMGAFLVWKGLSIRGGS